MTSANGIKFQKGMTGWLNGRRCYVEAVDESIGRVWVVAANEFGEVFQHCRLPGDIVLDRTTRIPDGAIRTGDACWVEP